MNCEAFDRDIQLAFQNYGPLGVKTELLRVRDTATAHGDMIDVMIGVTIIVPEMPESADTWHYGGVITRTTSPRPLGIQGIDRSRLISACEAAGKLPLGFPLEQASATLYWPLVPSVDEPHYYFSVDSTVILVGAYSGAVQQPN